MPPSLDSMVTYGRQLRVVANREAAEATLRGYLTRQGKTTRVPLGSGKHFGLRTSVEGWLILNQALGLREAN